MKALIAMSGGVDSSVAALLMQRSGYTCLGSTMLLHENSEDTAVPSRDEKDARAVADRLGMPFYVFDCRKEFRERVVLPFAEEYLSGRTPNPCIECNRHLKFGRLIEKADELECDVIATGHYARLEEKNGQYFLYRAPNKVKDQSYVLWSLSQETLSRVRFPLGAMSKDEVRTLAAENGFLNADRPDSQDICFVPDGDYAGVVRKITGRGTEPGNYVTADGKVLGQHKGIIGCTVGQHRGLGLGYHEKLYVLRINADTNEVILGHPEELLTDTVRLSGCRFIAGNPPKETFDCNVCLRYHGQEIACRAEMGEDGSARLTLSKKVRRPSAGQSAVFYSDDLVLGGGIIENVIQ